MSFIEIFKDNNDWNEKTIIGACSFVVLVLFAGLDLITGFYGKELIVSDTILQSFMILTLGSFGIASAENIFPINNKKCNCKK